MSICKTCNKEFKPYPRYKNYCSPECKPGNHQKGKSFTWNKGKKMTKDEMAHWKPNSGQFSKGNVPWCKGKPNPLQSKKWLGEGNPNWNGKMNKARPKVVYKEGFLEYKEQVWKHTRRTVRDWEREGKYTEELSNRGKYVGNLHIDHIIPFQQGFDEGILPEVMGSEKNLQFLSLKENVIKSDKWQTQEVIDGIR